MTKFNIEEMVIDLYYWFDKSTKRKANLAEYCTFCDTNYREIVKHATTRWLSLERAVSRILQQYAALTSYCLSEGTLVHWIYASIKLIYSYKLSLDHAICLDDAAPRFKRLQALFLKPMSEIHLLFYQSVLQLFIHFNMFLQREDPLIPVLYDQMVSFLTKLAGKFLPVAAIRAAKGDFYTLKYREYEDQLQGLNSCTPYMCII